MLVKVVLTIISSKVRAADNTASRLFYHFTSLSLNHHHPLLIIVISIHSSNPPSLSLHLSLWTVPSIVCFLSLFYSSFFFLTSVKFAVQYTSCCCCWWWWWFCPAACLSSDLFLLYCWAGFVFFFHDIFLRVVIYVIIIIIKKKKEKE